MPFRLIKPRIPDRSTAVLTVNESLVTTQESWPRLIPRLEEEKEESKRDEERVIYSVASVFTTKVVCNVTEGRVVSSNNEIVEKSENLL